MKVTLKTMEQIEKLGLEGQNVARGYYKSIFDMVANKRDWKGPISRSIEIDKVDADDEVIRHAVIYFTGNPDCKVTVVGFASSPSIYVHSAGYRAGPCGG